MLVVYSVPLDSLDLSTAAYPAVTPFTDLSDLLSPHILQLLVLVIDPVGSPLVLLPLKGEF